MDFGQWVVEAAIVSFFVALGLYLSRMFHQLLAAIRGELPRAGTGPPVTRTELKGDLAELRAELKDDLAEFRAEVRTDLADVRAGLRELEHRTYDLARQEPAADGS